VDLSWHAPAGRRVVRCEHGHAFDPANAFRDPRSPLDSPLGQHVVQEVLPEVTRSPLLADLPALQDPNAAGQLLASRLVYQQLGRRAWWLLLPLAAALLLRAPLLARALSRSGGFGHLQRWLLITGAGLLVDAVVLVALAVFAARTVYAAMSAGRLGPRGADLNGPPRSAAAALCGQGLAGLVTGHTHQPELAAVPGGFYANSGCGLRCLQSRPARLGLPPVFAPVLRRSWLELAVEHDVQVRLVLAENPTGEATRLERLVARRQPARPDTPQVVADLPGRADWPLREPALGRRARHERVRRRAALAVTEAIVDCTAFTLEGRPMKGLRGAYNRVMRAGYTVRFYDPARLPAELADELRQLMTQSRRGEVERGFSMTLSRIFDPADAGLLLAVAHGPDGRAGAFCQWVPAPDISGWSLDLMRRRADPELPNGLTDAVIIETIHHLNARGQWGLALNFAVMRAVLAGQCDRTLVTDLERRVLHRLSDTVQVESLWRFNEKYRPYWRPRYVVLGDIGSIPAQGVAIATAEGITELPVIGRFLGRQHRPVA
jgi:hypothetical protein